MSRLTHNNHDRDVTGMTYVYPVLSRRSKGLSIGINLNPNNACNWACLYCQVPDLVRGSAPRVDIQTLKLELRALLESNRSGAMSEQFELGPDEATLRDIAISGNGEPTSCPNFLAVTEAIGEVAEAFELLGKIKFVLINQPGTATVRGAPVV
jgi:wyosine [tRNA(Phe)-imidazoG37] synthetase (radical SAM superfamily)